MQAKDLPEPKCRQAWTWIYADGRMWATDGAIVLLAAPAGGETLAPGETSAKLVQLLLTRGERCGVGPIFMQKRLEYTGDFASDPVEVDDTPVRVINGAVYDAEYIGIVERAWPSAQWSGPPGMAARALGRLPAVARVDGAVVALVMACWDEPPKTASDP
jgi:hypothetical protein